MSSYTYTVERAGKITSSESGLARDGIWRRVNRLLPRGGQTCFDDEMRVTVHVDDYRTSHDWRDSHVKILKPGTDRISERHYGPFLLEMVQTKGAQAQFVVHDQTDQSRIVYAIKYMMSGDDGDGAQDHPPSKWVSFTTSQSGPSPLASMVRDQEDTKSMSVTQQICDVLNSNRVYTSLRNSQASSDGATVPPQAGGSSEAGQLSWRTTASLAEVYRNKDWKDSKKPELSLKRDTFNSSWRSYPSRSLARGGSKTDVGLNRWPRLAEGRLQESRQSPPVSEQELSEKESSGQAPSEVAPTQNRVEMAPQPVEGPAPTIQPTAAQVPTSVPQSTLSARGPPPKIDSWADDDKEGFSIIFQESDKKPRKEYVSENEEDLKLGKIIDALTHRPPLYGHSSLTMTRLNTRIPDEIEMWKAKTRYVDLKSREGSGPTPFRLEKWGSPDTEAGVVSARWSRFGSISEVVGELLKMTRDGMADWIRISVADDRRSEAAPKSKIRRAEEEQWEREEEEEERERKAEEATKLEAEKQEREALKSQAVWGTQPPPSSYPGSFQMADNLIGGHTYPHMVTHSGQGQVSTGAFIPMSHHGATGQGFGQTAPQATFSSFVPGLYQGASSQYARPFHPGNHSGIQWQAPVLYPMQGHGRGHLPLQPPPGLGHPSVRHSKLHNPPAAAKEAQTEESPEVSVVSPHTTAIPGPIPGSSRREPPAVLPDPQEEAAANETDTEPFPDFDPGYLQSDQTPHEETGEVQGREEIPSAEKAEESENAEGSEVVKGDPYMAWRYERAYQPYVNLIYSLSEADQHELIAKLKLADVIRGSRRRRRVLSGSPLESPRSIVDGTFHTRPSVP